MTDQRKVQLGVEVDATGAKKGFDQVKQDAQSMAQSVAQAGQAAGKGVAAVGDGAEAGAKKVVNATGYMEAAIKKQIALQERLAAGDKGSGKFFEVQARQMGANTEAIKPLLAQLDALREKNAQAFNGLSTGAASMDKLGVSAGQTAAALRNVPAQLTDIVVSLQAGQAPLTVLLQQGGQLKDMFGGIGPAAKALGGYVLSLVNPFSLAAAAAGGLAFAYHEGSKESQAYNRALILTGNAAGTTAGQLADMAARISKFGSTQGAAAAALAELAGTGKIAAANLEQFSRVALQMEKTVGQSVAETAKDLAELGRSPVEASEKLSEKYRYLTSTIYEQIKALQDQGRQSEASALAQKAYADSFDSTTKNLEQNLGVIEKGWRGIIGVAKGAWDAMLGVGRKRTLSEQLADVTAEITKGERPFDPSVGGNAEARAKLASNRDLQASIQELIRLEQRQGTVVSANNEQNAARIAWLKEGDKFLSKSAQMEREIAKARNEGAAAGASQTEVEKRIADIREKYKTTTTTTANTEVANIKARILGEQQYLDLLKLHGAAADQLNQGEKDALKYSEQLKGSLDAKTRARVQELLVQSQISAGILKETDALKDSIKAQADFEKERAKDTAQIESRIGKINDQAKAIEDEVAMYGLGEVAIKSLTIARLEDEKAELRRFDGSAERIAQIDAEIEAINRRATASDALKAKDESTKAAKKLTDEWKRDFDRIEDWIGDAVGRGVTKGKDFFKSLIDGVKASFARLVLSPIIQPIAAFGASMLNPGAAQANGAVGAANNAYSLYNTASNAAGLYNSGMALLGGAGAMGAIGASGVTAGTLGAASGLSLAGAGTGVGFTAGGAATGLSLAGSGAGVGFTAGSAAAGAATTTAGAVTGAAGTTAAGSVTAALGAIPVWGWAAMAALAIAAFAKGGETRFGGGYTVVDGKAKFMGGPDGGEIAGQQVRAMIDATNVGLQESLKVLGSTSALTFFNAGLESSKNGKGGVFAGGALDGVQFGDTDQTKTYNQNLSPEEAVKALGVELQKATLEAIQSAADIPKSIADQLNGVDIKGLTAEVTATLFNSINGQITAVKAFQTAVVGLPFENLKNLSFDAANGLIAAAGGFDALNSKLGSYYQNYFTEAERQAQTTKNLTKTFGDLGLALPTSREQFRNMVESLDLTTEAGRNTFAALMGAADALSTILPPLDAMVDSLSSLKNAASSAFSDLQKSVDAERTKATKRYDDQIAATRLSIDDVTKSVSKLSNLSSTLKSAVNGMNLPSQAGADRASASAQIQAALAIAKAGGVFPDSSALQNALSVVAQPNEQLYSSFVEFQRAYLKDKNAISELADLTDGQLSVEQQMLASLQDQLGQTEAARATEMAYFDSVLASAKEQLDMLSGISTSILGLSAALQAFAAARTAAAPAASAAIVASTPASADPSTFVQSMYASILGRAGEAAGVANWVTALQGGMTPDQVRQQFLASEEFRNLPRLATGTNFLPADMPIVAHQGERIIPAADNRELLARLRSPGGAESNAALIAEIRMLRATVEKLQDAVSDGNENTRQLADQFDNLTEGGNAMRTEVMA